MKSFIYELTNEINRNREVGIEVLSPLFFLIFIALVNKSDKLDKRKGLSKNYDIYFNLSFLISAVCFVIVNRMEKMAKWKNNLQRDCMLKTLKSDIDFTSKQHLKTLISF